MGPIVLLAAEEATFDPDITITPPEDLGEATSILIPNAEVFSSTIVNLTRRGRRRSRIVVGIDYRDDHDAAGGLIEAAVTLAPGVLDSPAPQARYIELGESSVDFEIRYWTAPDIASVVDTRDAVLRGVKSAIEDAGLNIPWPIRTLSFDNTLTHAASNGDGP